MQTGYKVMDIMTNKPIISSKDFSLKEAAQLMHEKNINSLIVTEDDEAVGIVTDEDIVRKVIAKGLDAKKMKLKDVMATDIITITPNRDIYDALLMMRDHNIRQLPVVSNKKLVGLLTSKDVLKIEPELIDIMVEKYEIREEERKMSLFDDIDTGKKKRK